VREIFTRFGLMQKTSSRLCWHFSEKPVGIVSAKQFTEIRLTARVIH
jgi:hypothetical protein